MKDANKPKTSRSTAAFGVPGKGWESLRGAFELFRKRKLIVIVSFVLLFAILCGCQYLIHTRTAGTVLSLDYEEASQGLAPNRTRFNIYEIRSSEIMERLIESAGLEGKITPEELSECISIKATHDRNISSNVNYISTSFVIRFTNKGAALGRSADEMASDPQYRRWVDSMCEGPVPGGESLEQFRKASSPMSSMVASRVILVILSLPENALPAM